METQKSEPERIGKLDLPDQLMIAFVSIVIGGVIGIGLWWIQSSTLHSPTLLGYPRFWFDVASNAFFIPILVFYYGETRDKYDKLIIDEEQSCASFSDFVSNYTSFSLFGIILIIAFAATEFVSFWR